MPFNSDLALDEHLDALDPLRHLMHQSDPDPKQSRSIHNETLLLSFPTTQPQVSISLSILSSYLVKRGPAFVRGRTILELGSGTGLVGLVAGALTGRSVWITDQAPLLDIMRRNVHKNGLEAIVAVAELNWGAPIPQEIPHPDLILAADCVYFEPAFPLLVQTLCDLVDLDPEQETEVLFCYKKRRKADKRFFGILKKSFSWTEVTDDPDKEMYNREAITLLRLFRRQPLVESSRNNHKEEARRRI